MPEGSGVARRWAGTFFIGLAVLWMMLTSAFAANNACEGVKLDLTKAHKQAYAPLVAAAMNNKVKPAQVEFEAIMESGDWSAAYISTPITDDGVMFFQSVNGKKQYRDVWGGFADPSEQTQLVSWAKKLGAPEKLAKCFAQTVTE
ncbi:hypothetical protein G6N74_25910 [Mesorhizobium sp. CGMCC 1.15528]|uniref:Uncharacterized protein n=1 Tax=Mesorhizobium zhangyense TaxID=1776730 RepID=A0A7C9V9T2_9HYPH|nr:hypothetical protein [Mesorhizobium zhangyense]NGN44505.1 hypothetical protein [Mesorhizobium zhangyense]